MLCWWINGCARLELKDSDRVVKSVCYPDAAPRSWLPMVQVVSVDLRRSESRSSSESRSKSRSGTMSMYRECGVVQLNECGVSGPGQVTK